MIEVEGLTATEAVDRLGRGEISAEALVTAYLSRIEALESETLAWQFLDPELALAQARAADQRRLSGEPLAPLHGLPIGIKDIIDTEDMPTENGTVLDAGRQPNRDAHVVSRLREAGAIILGKTVTTELAFYSPNQTRNPHDQERTPGGSSSGSAAAVARSMVPLALGSQTNGSVIRPASFCGVVGYKPTFGRISRSGILALSQFLDHVGVFGNSVEDVALLAEQIIGYDPNDPNTAPRARPRLFETATTAAPVEPLVAFVKSPSWAMASEDTQLGLAEVADALGDTCDEVELPDLFGRGADYLHDIMAADFAKNLQPYYERGSEQLSDTMKEWIERGRGLSAVDYNRAIEWRGVFNAGLNEIFERYDAILTPAAVGEAPIGLEATGDPIFSTLWTFCGVPCISLPILQGQKGLPIGIQLVGPQGDDARLLRTARHLTQRLTGAEDT